VREFPHPAPEEVAGTGNRAATADVVRELRPLPTAFPSSASSSTREGGWCGEASCVGPVWEGMSKTGSATVELYWWCRHPERRAGERDVIEVKESGKDRTSG
jgi:hypothetical protein